MILRMKPDGSITAELNAGVGYTVGTTSTALVTVLDNDDPVVSISADPTTITEGAAATFRVTLGSAAPAGGLTISVAVTESGSYIADLAPETVFIAEGALTVTLAVSTADDTTDESAGSITVRITTGAGYTVGSPNTAMVTVNDNDIPDPDAPVASISADPTPITEGTAATFTVALDRVAPAGGLTISVGVTESGSYIDETAPMTVVIAEGGTTGTLTVSTADDTTDEPAGNITAELNAGVGYTVGTTSTALVTVLDNDDPVVSISADPTTIIEGVAATFRVTLSSAAPADGLTISVAVTESGSYIAEPAPMTVFIAGGATTVTLAVLTDNDDMGERSGSITVRITTGAGYTVGTPSTALVTVFDNDTPAAGISADPTTITEGEDATFRVTLGSAAPADGLTISVGVTESGSYIADLAPETVFIAEGATTVTLAVSTEDDTTDEPAGSITVRITAGAGYTVGTMSTALVTVNDDDVLLVSITADPATITEGTAATFTVALDLVAPAGGVTVSVGVTESGSYIADLAPMTVFIAGGATTVTLAVLTDNDDMGERSGSITVRITTGAGYTVGTPSTALVTVFDNDTPAARISAGPSPITEGAAATFRVTLGSAAPAGGLTISVAVTESGSYIADLAPETVFIAEGALTGTLAVSTDDDTTDESAGSITVRITTGAGYTVGSPNTAMVTVNDNDIPDPDAPVASISADPTPITEGTAATFTVTLDRAAAAGGLTISVGVTESGSYIAEPAPMTVVIAEGGTTGTLTVSTADDTTDETDGSITAELNAGVGYTVGTTSTALVTVLDNDDPVVSISADPTTIIEGVAATFRVTLSSAAPADGLTISVAVTESGSYIAETAPMTVFIAGGATTVTLAVLTDNDDMGERSGSITVRITTGAGYTVGTPSTALVTVLDNDTPAARISADPTRITEGEVATFRVTLDSAAPAGGLTVSVDVTESGSYIDGAAPTEVVIAEGATTGTLAVSTEDDSLDESAGSITAELNTGTGYTVGTPNTAMVTVNDNDIPDPDAPVASISADPTPITEGTAATFTVTLDRAAAAGGLTISVGVTESGSYIAETAPMTVVIAEGGTTGTLTVSTADDTTDEPAGSITAELNAGTGYTVGTTSTAMVTVLDNDDPVVSISADPTTIIEGVAATFRVTLSSAAPADGLTISVGVTESGSYIADLAPMTVFIAGGATTVTLAVLTDNDDMGERSGSITVRITTGVGYTVGTPSTALVTVFDNDTPAAGISADPTTITEGAAATFRVTLGSAAPADGLTISVGVTESGSYIADLAPETVFIAEGATTVTLAVSTEDDTTDEPAGSITVRITAGAGYTVGTMSTALVTVNDDDVLLVSITADPATITEGTAATFTVALDLVAPAGGLTVSVGVTESGSYIDDLAPETVFIAGGATTVTLAVSTDDDAADEPDGIITAELNAGAGYTVGTMSTALVTVNDDDVLLASISAGRSPITEGTDATFTVALDRVAPAGGLTISVDVTDSGSYISGSVPETVVIAEGATTVTLTVLTDDDSLDEPAGSITVRITAGAGYTVGTLSTALVTVNDNDDPSASISADPTTIIEGVAATFRVTLSSAAPAGGLTISVGVTESGSYIADLAPMTVFIAGGATTVTLAVLTDNDDMGERSGSITVRITTGAGYTVGTPSTALVTVFDNDTPAARISAGPSPITEGAAATFRVTLGSAAPAGGLTISVGVTESGSYIADLAPETVFIAEGALTGTLAVSTDDDTG